MSDIEEKKLKLVEERLAWEKEKGAGDAIRSKTSNTGSIQNLKVVFSVISSLWLPILIVLIIAGLLIWLVFIPYSKGCPVMQLDVAETVRCSNSAESAKTVRGEFSSASYDPSKTAKEALTQILDTKNDDEDLEKAIFFFDAQVDDGSSGTVLSTDVRINNFYSPTTLVRDGWTPFDIDLFLDIQNTGTLTTDYDLIIQCSAPRLGDFDICALVGVNYTCEDKDDVDTVWLSEWKDYDIWLKGVKEIKLDRGIEDTVYCTARFGANSLDDDKNYDSSEIRNSFEDDQNKQEESNIKKIIYGSSITDYSSVEEDISFPYYKLYTGTDANGRTHNANTPLSWCHTVYKALDVLKSPDKFGTFSLTLEPVISMKKFVHARKTVSMMDLGFYLKNSAEQIFSEQNTRNTESPLIFSFIAGGQPKIVDSASSTDEVDKLLVGIVNKGEGAATDKDLVIIFLENRVAKGYKRPYRNPDFNIDEFEPNSGFKDTENFGQETDDWICSRNMDAIFSDTHFNDDVNEEEYMSLRDLVGSLDISQEAKDSTISDIENFIDNDADGVADPDEFFFCIPTNKTLTSLESESPTTLDIVYKQFYPSSDTDARFEGLMIYDYYQTGLSTELKISCSESKLVNKFKNVDNVEEGGLHEGII